MINENSIKENTDTQTEDILNLFLTSCRQCPRRCGVNRFAGQSGLCHVDGPDAQVSLVSLHKWEEPCISGKGGSGTVFFTGCSLGCIYCQNHEIAAGKHGYPVSVDRLASIFLEQQERGADNINLVTGAHFAIQIFLALEKAKKLGLHIPVIYNSSGYETVETLRLLEPVIDIYLPDFRYMDPDLARRYSKAPDYPETAMSALREMVRQKKQCLFDPNGMAMEGTIVRVLLLPGHVKDAQKRTQWLLDTFGDQVYISLMSQYTPVVEALPEDADPLLFRCVTKREYGRLVGFALEKGLKNGYWQDGEAARESFIPEFDGKGVYNLKTE